MSRPTIEQIARQVEAAQGRPPRTLPDVWREPGVAERMAEWIIRSKADAS